MDFFEIIDKRHSIRRFTEQEIPRESVAKILKAALSAPSSKNCRSTSFMIVETPELLGKISEMRDFGSSFLKHAPMGIVVMGDEALTDLWVDNAAIAGSYVQLAAVALGLATCWVHVNGRPRKKDDSAAGSAEDYLREVLPVPEGRRILCVIALGYADPDANTVPRPESEGDKIITVG